MVIKEKLEEKIHRTERKLLELALHIHRLNQEYHELLNELAVTPEELKDFVENSENFSPSTWEELQKEKKQLEERLNSELSNVRDANKAKDTFSEKGKIQQHWLFVR
jgi:hypothetical protein